MAEKLGIRKKQFGPCFKVPITFNKKYRDASVAGVRPAFTHTDVAAIQYPILDANGDKDEGQKDEDLEKKLEAAGCDTGDDTGIYVCQMADRVILSFVSRESDIATILSFDQAVYKCKIEGWSTPRGAKPIHKTVTMQSAGRAACHTPGPAIKPFPYLLRAAVATRKQALAWPCGKHALLVPSSGLSRGSSVKTLEHGHPVTDIIRNKPFEPNSAKISGKMTMDEEAQAMGRICEKRFKVPPEVLCECGPGGMFEGRGYDDPVRGPYLWACDNGKYAWINPNYEQVSRPLRMAAAIAAHKITLTDTTPG